MTGIKIKVLLLDHPGYRVIIKLLPEFERAAGIEVADEVVPCENAREKQVPNFTSKAT